MIGLSAEDPDKPRAWSKYSALRSKPNEEETKSAPPTKKPRKEDEIIKKCQEDPAFLEFLETQKSGKVAWGNDSIFQELKQLSSSKPKTKDGDGDGDSADDADSVNDCASNVPKLEATVEDPAKSTEPKKKLPDVEYFTIKIRGMPKRARKGDLKSFFQPLKPKSIRFITNTI